MKHNTLKLGNSLSYREIYEYLQKSVAYSTSRTKLSNTSQEILSLPFSSPTERIFPTQREYYAPRLGGSLLRIDSQIFGGAMEEIVKISDAEIAENRQFKYLILREDSPRLSEGVIFLFHGLNEKDWTKYLPWAQALQARTGKAVVMFPTAFHMNRAFKIWHDSRLMANLSKSRSGIFSQIRESSFVNAAISTRLHFAPARFFLSGLETYANVISLVEQIRAGQHEYIEAQASVDFIGYSAGAFLTQILLMADRDGLFSQSRGVLFCGGALLSRMHLTSRYIMDSEAHQAIQYFYTGDFDEHLRQDENLRHHYDKAKRGGLFFRSMLSERYTDANQIRRQRLGEIGSRLKAISLAQDQVMRPHEIQASLVDSEGRLAVPTQVLDYEHPYSHVMPFSHLPKHEAASNEAFQHTFDIITKHLM